uniref:Uncharacterized protein n=1 Tax=Ralstonia solanacearum TaxID=305 RepID=A0A0S4WWB1_RALSL|nr:protein of unknown function [Ralstonia solanacearum]
MMLALADIDADKDINGIVLKRFLHEGQTQ